MRENMQPKPISVAFTVAYLLVITLVVGFGGFILGVERASTTFEVVEVRPFNAPDSIWSPTVEMGCWLVNTGEGVR